MHYIDLDFNGGWEMLQLSLYKNIFFSFFVIYYYSLSELSQ